MLVLISLKHILLLIGGVITVFILLRIKGNSK